ncbi:biotin-dependent carboxyltransferase family protein [Pseudomonas sp.]|uniref:5-oxoprolinase subunit C family protein n=1 Tax=Pseudomonas sp. TaxID=306 RepID=UPI002624A5E3|nr:biotin-dependent carboxyltransferase family protein [Pseudomonas sp.]
MSSFHVLNPGLLTTLQDRGRTGYEDRGVPPSGALDELSFAIANALVGNPAGTGALEFTLVGGEFLVGQGGCVIAVTGDMQVFIDDQPVAPYQCHVLRSGAVLKVGRALSGARGYLAVAGGFAVEPVLGSVSTLMRGALGGFAGRAIAKGDELPLAAPSQYLPLAARAPGQRFLPQREHQPLRVVLGPQQDHFSPAEIQRFLSESFQVSSQSDRMGYRMTGPVIAHLKGFNIVSDAISTGSVQIPGSGNPIIAMHDRQTTGGYPKIATVIRADLARLGQLKPGDWLSFAEVSVEDAEDLWCGRQVLLNAYLDELLMRYHRRS